MGVHEGQKRGYTIVDVEFSVNGRTYRCTTLHLFAGNRHWRDVGNAFDVNPGKQVVVFYDPEKPRRNALVLDDPRYVPALIPLFMSVLFIAFAVLFPGS